MDLRGIHHVSINVSDNEVAAEFYVKTLGLDVLARPDFGFPGTWLSSANGVQIHLIEVDGWVAPEGQHYAFAVDDVDASVASMRAAGCEIDDPVDVPGTTARQAFTSDPSGNIIEFNQPPT